MSLEIIVSPSIEELVSKMGSYISNCPPSVFQPVTIVTQTSGMDNWLKYRMAEKLGIAANFRYLKQADLIGRVYSWLGGSYRQQLWSGSTEWLVFKLLNEEVFKTRFPEIASYYLDTSLDGTLKRLGFAQRIADLFDQYQIYRPDMIREWNQSVVSGSDSTDWQKYLWKRLKEVSADAIPDKTVVADFILKQLQQEEVCKRLKERLPVVHLFGLSVLTDYHMRLFNEMGRSINMVFYMVVPSMEVMEGTKTENKPEWCIQNALLNNWGQLICESTAILTKANDQILWNTLLVNDNTPDCLLKKLQYDIRNNKEKQTAITVSDLNDGSLTINACYTPVREIESLYNYLVRVIETQSEPISPRDIVVLMSDVDAYAPYVKAVFDHAPYKIPYSIEGESKDSSEGVITALTTLLEIDEQSFTSETVVRLLDSKLIRARFAITDVPLIRQIIDKANIRFGISGRNDDDSYLVSWLYGIKRIVYGICMSGGDEYRDEDVSLFPIDDLEGKNSHELIRFVHFVQMLIEMVQTRSEARPLAQWTEYVEQVLENFVEEASDEASEEYSMVQSQLTKLNSIGELMSEQISYELFTSNFMGQLSENTTSTHYRGGVVFSSFIPMRSLPFKVIAMLGLNFDKFPRKDKQLSYDLMAGDKQQGDRRMKDNDKHLFLETLMAAREKLYISYIGRHAKDNSKLPPSSLVDELIDYIETGCDASSVVRNELVTLQPLHSFSSKYGTGKYFSYLKQTTAEVDVKALEPQPVVTDFTTIELNRLIAFFKNPFKTYYNNVLGIDYTESETEQLAETELFELDHLQQWLLKNELLQMGESDIPEFVRRGVMNGNLPLKNMAAVNVELIDEGINDLKLLYKKFTNGHGESSFYIDLIIGDSNLEGQINGVFNNQMVFVCFSSNQRKYFIDAAIRYLAARAQGLNVGLQFVYIKKVEKLVGKKKVEEEVPTVTSANTISAEEALQSLEKLIRCFKLGHESIWPYYPDFHLDAATIGNLSFDELHQKLGGEFSRFINPIDEPHITSEFQRGFFDDDQTLKAFKSNSETILGIVTSVFPESNL